MVVLLRLGEAGSIHGCNLATWNIDSWYTFKVEISISIFSPLSNARGDYNLDTEALLGITSLRSKCLSTPL